jgi:hypothetical protein
LPFFGFGQIHLLFAETRQDNFLISAKILNIRVLFWTSYKKDGLLLDRLLGVKFNSVLIFIG